MGAAADHRKSVKDAFWALRPLEYDWDGAGGLPLRSDVIYTVTCVYEWYGLGDHHLIPLALPEVALNGNGTAEVAYSGPDTGRQLLLTFECAGVVTYVQVFEDEQTTIEGTIRAPSVGAGRAELCGLFEWLATE